MPFIPAANTARVVVKTELHDQVVNNVYHVRKDLGWSLETLQDVCNTFITWWNTDLAPNLGQGYNLLVVSARDLTEEEGLGTEVQAPDGSGGDLLNPLMPGNVTLTIKHVTGYSGANRRGRSFQAGFVENQQEGNELTIPVRNAILTAYDALRGAIEAMDCELVVASFYNGTSLVELPDGQIVKRPTPRATALITPIIAFTADTFLDSQRRRLTGRGV